MRDSNPSPRALVPLALAILALTLASCGKAPAPLAPTPDGSAAAGVRNATGDAAAAQAAGQGTFYPLQLGNHWSYERALSIYFDPEDGPPDPAFGQRHQRDRDLVCVEQLSGSSYVVERIGSPVTPSFWVRYRQDEAGLYEADMDVSLPPSCTGATGRRAYDVAALQARANEEAWSAVGARLDPAKHVACRAAWDRLQARAAAIRRVLGTGPEALPRAAAGDAGVEPGEITRLEYPLRPGVHWVIRADPLFESTVEAAEVLDLPAGRLPGWRIRIDSVFLGPNDRVHFWFGRSGFLKSVAHFEDQATDSEGNPIGRFIAEETEDLLELSLSRGRFATP